MNILIHLASLVSLFACFFSRAEACSSCGSGGDDVISLCPFENWKLYAGIMHSSHFKSVMSDGTRGADGGPSTKIIATTAIGKQMTPESYFTLAFPYQYNSRDSRSQFSTGDLALSASWVALAQAFDEPLVPQIKFTVGHKFGERTSLYDSKDPALLDVFGTGFAETKFGADIWFGMFPTKFGLSRTQVLVHHRHYSGMAIEPGNVSRTTVTTGYGIEPWGSLVFGITNEERANLRVDGNVQENSNQSNQSIFTTLDWKPWPPFHSIRFNFARRAAFGSNKDTSQSDNFTFAYVRSL